MNEGDTIITILYGLIGATGAASVVVFVWGFIEYITKIGLPSKQRDHGIAIMEWAVRLIVTAIFLILVRGFLEARLS